MADRARVRRRRRARKLGCSTVQSGLACFRWHWRKVIRSVSPKTQFGFLGISYVTFRLRLDIVFCLRDRVIAKPGQSIYSCSIFFPRFPPARSIVIAASLPTGEKHEAGSEF